MIDVTMFSQTGRSSSVSLGRGHSAALVNLLFIHCDAGTFMVYITSGTVDVLMRWVQPKPSSAQGATRCVNVCVHACACARVCTPRYMLHAWRHLGSCAISCLLVHSLCILAPGEALCHHWRPQKTLFCLLSGMASLCAWQVSMGQWSDAVGDKQEPSPHLKNRRRKCSRAQVGHGTRS
eukprot:1077012-Pelagomonas_calceolata.AAC.8